MKKIMRLGRILILSLLILLTIPCTAYSQEYEPRLTAPNGEPYYTSALNVYSKTGYGMPNCVAYAYGRIYELNGEAPLINHGDAGQWWFINKNNDYYDYGSEPQLGAVACWSNHVAVVEKISDNGAITVSESHWGSKYFDVKTYYNMYSHYGQTFYGYIYTYTPQEEEEEPKYYDFTAENDSNEIEEKNHQSALEFASNGIDEISPENNELFNF